MAQVKGCLVVGLSKVGEKLIQDKFPDLEVKYAPTYDELEAVLSSSQRKTYEVLVCGDQMEDVTLSELAQALRSDFPNSHIMGLLFDRRNLNCSVTQYSINLTYMYNVQQSCTNHSKSG